MKTPELDDRLRQYLAREPEAPAGLEERVLRDPVAGSRRPAMRLRVEPLIAAAFLVLAAGVAFAVHTARQNADQPRPAPTASATPPAIVATPTASAPPGVPGVVSSIHMVTPLNGWAGGAETSEDRTLIVNLAILRTTDGGVHWKNASPPLSFSWQPTSTYYLDETTAWTVSIQPGVSVLRTTDGGAHWLNAPIPGLSAISPPLLNFVDAQHGWMLVGQGSAAGSEDVALYQTLDGGAGWQRIAVADTQNRPGHIPFGGQKTGMTFINRDTGWITGTYAGSQPLFSVTHDGGRTWNPQSLAAPSGVDLAGGVNISAPRFFSSTSGELAVDAMRTVIYTTLDGGASWQPHVAPDAGPSFFLDGRTGWLYSSDGQTLYRTTDGGQHWQSVHLQTVTRTIDRLDFVTPMIGYAVLSPLIPIQSSSTPVQVLMRTEDGGINWTSLPVAVS